MSTATVTIDVPARKAPPSPRNGVDTPSLLATIGVVAGQPALAQFQFRAKGRWIAGTHSRTVMASFSGAGGEHAHLAEYSADGDHPAVLCGADQGPTPVEWVLHALATCLTAGIANIAAVRGVTLERVESTVEGDIDLRGILGLSQEVRNGYQGIRVRFEIEGDAPAAKLREIVEQSRARSAVFDILTNGVPVTVEVSSFASTGSSTATGWRTSSRNPSRRDRSPSMLPPTASSSQPPASRPCCGRPVTPAAIPG